MLLHKPLVRTTHALKSFRNVGMSKWNDLNEDIRSSSTLSGFNVLCKGNYLLSCKTR